MRIRPILTETPKALLLDLRQRLIDALPDDIDVTIGPIPELLVNHMTLLNDLPKTCIIVNGDMLISITSLGALRYTRYGLSRTYNPTMFDTMVSDIKDDIGSFYLCKIRHLDVN